jgi:S1-C subfamily serine protease
MSLLVSVDRTPVDASTEPLVMGTATAFVVREDGRDYLVTNWHVLAGRDPVTGEFSGRFAAPPETLKVLHNASDTLTAWEYRTHDLYDEGGNALWLVHPSAGQAIDVVALPLPPARSLGVAYYPYALDTPANPLQMQVTSTVNIIGFPFGRVSAGGIGIWARGSVASEPGFDFDGRPLFLVDSRTRPGQSGSPVISHSLVGPTVMQSGATEFRSHPSSEFQGVYSGRMNNESDLGFVWKRHVVREVIQGGKRDSLKYE